MKRLFLTAFLIASAFLIPPAWAQDMPQAEAPADSGGSGEDMSDMDVIIMEKDISLQDEYVPAKFTNLSRLYWAMGKLNIDSNADIDNFLLINECDLYKQYINNDLEWAELRKAVQAKINKDLATYPRKFEVLIPLYLGEYNTNTSSFALRKGSGFDAVQRLEVAPNDPYVRICDIPGEVPNYPRNMILILNRPFSLDHVPVQPELAKLYIEETRKKFEELPPRFQSEKYKRVAYLRIKVTVTKYKETIILGARQARAVFFAQWDGFEVYADPTQEKLLYKEEAKSMKARRKSFESLKRAAEEQDRKIREGQEKAAQTPPDALQQPQSGMQPQPAVTQPVSPQAGPAASPGGTATTTVP